MLTAILIFNPFTLSIILFILIVTYSLLLISVAIYSTWTTLRDYSLTRLKPYLDEKALQFLKQAHIDTIQDVPIVIQSSLVSKIIMAGPLFVYLSTKFIVHMSLSLCELWIQYMIAAGPWFLETTRTVYRYAIAYVIWVRSWTSFAYESLFYPIWRRLMPLVFSITQRLKRILKNVGIMITHQFVTFMNLIWIRGYKISRKAIKWVLRFSTILLKASMKIWNERIIPFLEGIRQICWRIWPIIKLCVFLILETCEKLDKEYRPLIFNSCIWIKEKTLWLQLIVMTFFRVTIETFLLFFVPFIFTSFYNFLGVGHFGVFFKTK